MCACIPVLVDGARMPRADELPDSLAGLVRRQALELSPSRFDSDTNRLARVLASTLAEVRAAAQEPDHRDAVHDGTAASSTAEREMHCRDLPTLRVPPPQTTSPVHPRPGPRAPTTPGRVIDRAGIGGWCLSSPPSRSPSPCSR